MTIYSLFSINSKYPEAFRLFHCDLPNEILARVPSTEHYFGDEEIEQEYKIKDLGTYYMI